jgi:hypothetical protein
MSLVGVSDRCTYQLVASWLTLTTAMRVTLACMTLVALTARSGILARRVSNDGVPRWRPGCTGVYSQNVMLT